MSCWCCCHSLNRKLQMNYWEEDCRKGLSSTIIILKQVVVCICLPDLIPYPHSLWYMKAALLANHLQYHTRIACCNRIYRCKPCWKKCNGKSNSIRIPGSITNAAVLLISVPSGCDFGNIPHYFSIQVSLLFALPLFDTRPRALGYQGLISFDKKGLKMKEQ